MENLRGEFSEKRTLRRENLLGGISQGKLGSEEGPFSKWVLIFEHGYNSLGGILNGGKHPHTVLVYLIFKIDENIQFFLVIIKEGMLCEVVINDF